MKYNVTKNWIASYELLAKNKVIFLPFIWIAFFEALALVVVFFSARQPISFVASPIIKKFFGEMFIHYPAHLAALPRIFYFLQILVYIFLGTVLSAVAVNVFKNLRSNLPIKIDVFFKNIIKRYFSFIMYGVIVVVCLSLVNSFDSFVIGKVIRLIARTLPKIPLESLILSNTIINILINIFVQLLFILTIPFLVIKGYPLMRSIGKSIYMVVKHPFVLLRLIFIPFLCYLPVTILKSLSVKIGESLFPEVTACIIFLGIIVSLFVDSFVFICAAQFVLDMDKDVKIK